MISVTSQRETAEDRRLIFDIGMNNGDDTAYYLYSGFRVVAVEADPTLVEEAKKRFASHMDSGRLEILNVGIGPEETTVPFWICEGKSEWNSFNRDVASSLGRSCHSIDVACIRFGKLIELYGTPYYLKIDIEGHDHYCLDDLRSDTAPRYLSCELAERSMIDQLARLGFSKFKIILQNDYSQLEARNFTWSQWFIQHLKLYSLWYRVSRTVQTRMNRSVQERLETDQPVRGKWVFPYGASGPFAEDTAGEWQSLEETRVNFDKFSSGRSVYGRRSLGLWLDIHATR